MSRPAAPNPLSPGFAAPPRPLRRLALELFGIVVLKVAVLMVIWWVAFAPQPKPDVSPAAVSRWLAPAPQPPPETSP